MLEAARARGINAEELRRSFPLRDEFIFVGLAGLADPPRPEAKDAISACRTAGIHPVLVTGDHPLTACAIAEQVGLSADGRVVTGPELDALSDEALREVAEHVTLYARTTPEHKLRLVKALQADGERVAVTGDGINDAPASAAFVSEPAEPGVMHQPPRDPRAPFMDRAMLGSIFSAAAGLFAAVSLVYLIAWYSGVGLSSSIISDHPIKEPKGDGSLGGSSPY